MAVSWDAVKEGDTLYQKKRQKMGNTTMSCDAVFEVKIIEKHDRHAIVRWNWNQPTTWRRSQIERLFRNRPKTKARPGYGATEASNGGSN